MTEGTISYLIGCHQFFLHPLWVLIAWYKEYKEWPKFWELCCIFLHDVGHIGRQYLSNPEQKKNHWVLGARIALQLFGPKGFMLIAGHVSNSGFRKSRLFIPDKRSWVEVPLWWLKANYMVEDFGTDAAWPERWQKIVKENMKKGYPKDSHELYLENKGEHRL